MSLTRVSFALETSHETSFTDVGIAVETVCSPNAGRGVTLVIGPWKRSFTCSLRIYGALTAHVRSCPVGIRWEGSRDQPSIPAQPPGLGDHKDRC